MQRHVIPSIKGLFIAAVAALTLGTAPSADAGYVVLGADPVYGPPFPNLGWRASGVLNIPDACLAAMDTASVTYNLSTTSGPCDGMQIEDTRVHLYNTGTPGTTVEILQLGTYTGDAGPPNGGTDITQELLSVSFSRGQVVGFDTSLSFPILATSPLAGAGNNRFSLRFSSFASGLFDFGASGTQVVSQSSFPPVITIGPVMPASVPEPGAWALMLGTLALAGGRRLWRRAQG